MPILNPRRILTRHGREQFLMAMSGADNPGVLEGLKVFAVTSVTVASDNSTLSDAVAAADGAGTARTVGEWSDSMMSASGKIFRSSDLLSFAVTTTAITQDVIGVVLAETNLTTGVMGFLEFDDPITLDENGELFQMSVEVGFDGQTFYLVPRILPLGE